MHRLLAVGLMAVVVALAACSDSSDEIAKSDRPSEDALAEVGTCRSNLARAEAQGRVGPAGGGRGRG